MPTPIFNKVVRSVVREGDGADAAIARALALYEAHSLPVVWWLFPAPVCKRLGFEVACEVRVLGRGL